MVADRRNARPSDPPLFWSELGDRVECRPGETARLARTPGLAHRRPRLTPSRPPASPSCRPPRRPAVKPCRKPPRKSGRATRTTAAERKGTGEGKGGGIGRERGGYR